MIKFELMDKSWRSVDPPEDNRCILYVYILSLSFVWSDPVITNPEKQIKVWPLEWWEIENNTQRSILQLCDTDSLFTVWTLADFTDGLVGN